MRDHTVADASVRTFLIADIRGYTAFTTRRGDAAASRLAGRFGTVATEAVEAHGGTLVELRGDEALGAFDSPRAALRCAVELQDAFAHETAADPSLPLNVGIGLDAGEAVAVGTGYRGSALNTAARLCSVAGPGQVLATSGLLHLAGPVEGLVAGVPTDMELKGLDGRVSAIPITTAAWESDVHAPARGPDDDSPTTARSSPIELDTVVPLAGRERELRVLRWHWRRARHGHGRVVVVSGPPGIGKTRLAAELAAEAHATHGTVTYLPRGRDLEGATAGAAASDGPSLIVVDDLDAAAATATEAVVPLADACASRAALLLVIHRLEASPALVTLAERLAPPGQRLALGPLDLDAVRMIAGLYAGSTVDRLPLARILEESGGHPASIHRSAHAWARRVATEHIGVAADLAAAQRHGLRSAEAAIVDEIAVLERADESERLIAGSKAAEEAAASVGSEASGSVTDRSAPSICPYKGLASFGPMDASYYHGRDRLVSEITARLVGSSFVGLLGASGSGKSSALLAGLLPALAAGVLPGSDRWTQLVMRPGSAPLDALEVALARVSADAVNADAGSSVVERLDAALASRPTGSRLVLIVDQFEELFASSHDPAQRSAFVDLITSGRDGLVTVAAMRADRYGDAAAYPALARAIAGNQVLVGPMTRDELIAAIERPAQQVGLRVEPGLTVALVDDAGSEPGVLPLLSTALLELWGAREGRLLTLAAYRESGGLRGAVARLAEDAWATLDPDRQARARAILLRLAGPGEGEAIVRRRVPLDEFDLAGDPLLADVIERLTAARLLTADEGHIEVAHEALLREWPRLAGWLEEDSVGRQLRLQLTSAARTWDGGGRERGDLYRGARLSLTLDEAAEHPEQLSPLERAFLDESRAAAAREAEDQRRTNRRLRLLLAGMAGFLLVAVSAGFLAAREASRADREADVARSRELAAAAIATLDDDPSLSKLLALEAASAGDPPLASIAALHTAYALDRTVRRIPVADTWTDVDPNARWLAVSSDPGEQRDAFEVLDLETGNEMWRYAAPPGATVSAARFLPDGERLVAGVRAAAPDGVGAGAAPAGGRPPAQALGIGVWSAGTGELLDWIEMGDCGGTVRDATEAFAVVSTPAGPDCAGSSSLELVGLGLHDRRTLTGSAVNQAVVTIDQPSLSRDGRFVAFTDPVGGRTVVAETSDLASVLELPALHDVRALSRDGSLVALGSSPVEVWDVANGARLATFAGHGGDALHVEFLPWADTVMSTGVDGTLRWWDPRTGRQLDDVPAAGNGRPTTIGRERVGMSSAGSSEYLVLEAGPRGEVAALDLCANVDPRGTFAVAGGNLDVVHGQVLTALTCEDRPWWTASSRLIDLTTGRTRYQIEGSRGQEQELSPDGTRFARQEGTPDGGVGTVSVRDLATGEIVVRMDGLCSWDESRLASDPSLTAEDTGAECRPFPETPFPIWTSGIRWSPDGKWLVANDMERRFSVIWRAETGELVATIPPSEGNARMLRPFFTPDGRQLLVPWVRTAAGEEENGIDVYSTGTWEKESSVTIEGSLELGVAPLGTSPDGRVLYALSGLGVFGGKVQLVWLDARMLQPVGPPIDGVHDGQLKASAFAPDRLRLATGSADGVVRVWDLGSRRLTHEVDLRDVYPGQQVQGLDWVDDRHLAAILGDGHLTVLTTDPEELLALAHQSLTRSFTPSECDRFGIQPCPVDATP